LSDFLLFELINLSQHLKTLFFSKFLFLDSFHFSFLYLIDDN
jgi:hypothetical protein